MTALIMVTSIAAYLIVAGIVYSLVATYLDEPALIAWSGFCAVIWPIAIPWALGMYVVRTPARWRLKARMKAKVIMAAVEAAEQRTRELEASELGIKDSLPEAPKPNLEDLRSPYSRYDYETWLHRR